MVKPNKYSIFCLAMILSFISSNSCQFFRMRNRNYAKRDFTYTDYPNYHSMDDSLEYHENTNFERNREKSFEGIHMRAVIE